MKIKTSDRELGCILLALNNSSPESSHVNRRRKDLVYVQMGLDVLEELALKGGPRETLPLPQWPANEREIEVEQGVVHYLVDKFGADGTIQIPAYAERIVCRFIEKLKLL